MTEVERGGRVVELAAPPVAGALYRRAVLRSLPGVGARGGDTLPDVELVLRGATVDRARLAEYDRVCGFGLSDTLPVTYPHILAFPLAMQLMSTQDFPLPPVGLVHVANRITIHRPITADERLDIAVRAVDLRPHERGRQFDVVATVHVDGELVWREVSTYLRRERPGGGKPPTSRSDSPPVSARWRVSQRVGVAYAAVSGDRNPIHTSRVGARLFGFPRPIAHGMWSKARCLAALANRLPDAYTVEVFFKLPMPLPATVAFSATRDATSGWEFALRDARSGRPHLVGTVR